MTQNRQHILALTLIVAATLAASSPAFASSSSMPWDTQFTQIMNSITGPVAKAIGVGAIVLCGLGLSFSEQGSWTRTVLKIVFGLSIAFSATSFGLTFFGYSGGATF